MSYRDLEELLAERGVEVDHVTLFRWVQRFTQALVEAARPCRHVVGDRWFVDETYVKVAGHWRYVYRAIDQYGQVIDVFVSDKRDTVAATRFFTAAIGSHGEPVEVTTDRARALAKVIEDQWPTPAEALAPIEASDDPVERVAFATRVLLEGVAERQAVVRSMIAATITRPELAGTARPKGPLRV